jgi:hypothetical protein
LVADRDEKVNQVLTLALASKGRAAAL